MSVKCKILAFHLLRMRFELGFFISKLKWATAAAADGRSEFQTKTYG